MAGLATAGDFGSALGPVFAFGLAVALDLRWVYLASATALASDLLATLGKAAPPVKERQAGGSPPPSS